MTGSGDREPRYWTRARAGGQAGKNTSFRHVRREKKGSILLNAWTEAHLWRNYFDELVEKAELAHLAVKPFAATLHARLEDLQKKHRVRPKITPAAAPRF